MPSKQIRKKSHATIKEKTALKKKTKDTAIKNNKKKQKKRQDSAKAFGALQCSICKEEKYKKKFSARQFKLANPKCIECVSKNKTNEILNAGKKAKSSSKQAEKPRKGQKK